MKTFNINRYQRGFNLMEVLIAIAVFAIGMLALGALQGALTRSSADARARAEAVIIAETLIEAQRSFRDLTGTAGFDYADIISVADFADPLVLNDVDIPLSATGFDFTASQVVRDYCYDATTDAFGTDCTGQAVADVKTVAVTVTWEGIDFDDAGSRLGSGTVTLTSIIPALVTSAAGQVAQAEEGELLAPPVTYTPGQNPDVVALSLGANKFKESLLPMPDVIRQNEYVETAFDVITYSTSDGGSVFLRREEFRAVSCECELNAADASNPGRTPTIWAGDEYIEGDFVAKPYGTVSNNQQSDLCDTCCRDHHDVADYPSYKPFESNSAHLHYQSDGVTPAQNGDEYLEACRLVRVNGFWRVAQDFRREDHFIFPEDFLDDLDEVASYSSYATSAADAFAAAADGSADYPGDMPCIGEVDCAAGPPPRQGGYPNPVRSVDASGDEVISLPSWTSLPFGTTDDTGTCFFDTATGELVCPTTLSPTQQLRSRGLYIDYLSSDLRWVIDCINGNQGVAEINVESCQQGGVILDRVDPTAPLNVLEILPFFDVQLTFLDRWTESKTNNPVDSTNEPLADGNTHSRGVISRASAPISETTKVRATGHRGNLGFTDTLPIAPGDNATPALQTEEIDVCVFATDGTGDCNDETAPEPPVTISGTFTESVQGNPDITIAGTSSDVLCDQTSSTWTCTLVNPAATNLRIIVSGYGYKPKNANDETQEQRYACSSLERVGGETLNQNAFATFNVTGLGGTSGYDIAIQTSSCPP